MDPDLDQTLIRIQIQANTIRIRIWTKKNSVTEKSSKFDLVLETKCTYLIDNSTSKYDDFLAKVAKDIFINANEGIWRVQNELKSGGIKNIKVIDLSQDKLSEKLRSAYLKSLSKLMIELLKMPALNELPGNNIKIMIETQSLCLLLVSFSF